MIKTSLNPTPTRRGVGAKGAARGVLGLDPTPTQGGERRGCVVMHDSTLVWRQRAVCLSTEDSLLLHPPRQPVSENGGGDYGASDMGPVGTKKRTRRGDLNRTPKQQ